MVGLFDPKHPGVEREKAELARDLLCIQIMRDNPERTQEIAEMMGKKIESMTEQTEKRKKEGETDG